MFSKLQPEQIWLQLNDKNNHFPPRHLAAALFQLSKGPVDRNRDLTCVLNQLRRHSNELRGRDVASILVACKRLGVVDAGFMKVMRDRVGEVCTELNAQEISNVLNALATSRDAVENLLLDALGGMVGKKINDFTPQNIANSLHAIAKFQLRNPVLLDTIYATTLDKASSFSATDVSITLEALGKLHCRNAELVARFCDEGLRTVDQFTVQGIANSLRALWVLGVREHALVARLIARAREHLLELKLEELCTMFKVLSGLRAVDEGLLTQIAMTALRNSRDFGLLSVNSLLSSLSVLTLPSSGSCQLLLGRLYLEAVKYVEKLTAAQVTEMLLALTRLGVYDSLLLEQLWQRSLEFAQDGSAEDVVVVLNSLLRFNAFNSHVVNLYCKRALSLHFSVSETVILLHAVSQVTPHLLFKDLTQRLLQDMRQLASSLSTAELVTTVYSQATLQQLDSVLFDDLRGRLALRETLSPESRGRQPSLLSLRVCAQKHLS